MAARTRKKTGKKTEADNNMQYWSILLFAGGIFLFFVSIIKGSNAWLYMNELLFGLFGACGFLLSPFVIYIAIKLAKGGRVSVKIRIFEALALVALFSGALEIFAAAATEGLAFFEIVRQTYENGVALKGGGVMSFLVAWPLTALLGDIGAKITVIILLFVFIMLMTGKGLFDLFSAFVRPVKRLEQVYNERTEHKANRFNIDIPLDHDKKPSGKNKKEIERIAAEAALRELNEAIPDELPDHPVFVETPSDDTSELFSNVMEKKPKLQNNILDVLFSEDEADSTPIAEIIPIKEQQPQPVITKPLEIRVEQGYAYPPVTLLQEAALPNTEDMTEELKQNATLLVDTLKSFGVQTRVIDISRGPAVTRYELQPSVGVKISKITSLSDDIALNLATAGVRIEAPIPNKAAVGIEVPNRIVSMVSIREIIDSHTFVSAKSGLTAALGKDISGTVTVADLSRMPHMLIAGSTGSGKSVCINSIIISLLYKSSPDDVRLLMVDPKVVELGIYNGIPHLLVPVVTDPKKAAGALSWAVHEMLDRYKLFAENSVRDLAGYNALAKHKEHIIKLPQIVIIIDELADLMMAAPNEVEDSICRLAQMARAAGMHLVIATQRPSVDVITGVIKANIPSRIAFAVSSQIDSRTILDGGGAEKLLGRGDMLFYPVGASKPVRIQGCFVSEKEIERVIEFIKNSGNADYDDDIMEEIERQAVKEKDKGKNKDKDGDTEDGNLDEMFPAAVECVIEIGQASTSLLQRRLKLGYARAARLVDEMEGQGIVGPFEGSKPRPVLITRAQWQELRERLNS